jgi:hypothetical protein
MRDKVIHDYFGVNLEISKCGVTERAALMVSCRHAHSCSSPQKEPPQARLIFATAVYSVPGSSSLSFPSSSFPPRRRVMEF